MREDALNLTIFLLKPSLVAAFEQKFPSDDPAAIPLPAPFEGRFIPIQSTPNTPRWVTILGSFLRLPATVVLLSQSPAGLMVVARGGRTFVITFGHAWLKLQDEWVEVDFGRRVALNLIAPDSLVEIRAEQVFARWHVASDRAPRAAAVDEFGVEFDRDLVAVVEGVPRDPKAFGRTVRGGTSLRVTLTLAELSVLLDQAEGLFLSDAYKKHWPDIDNLNPVRDQGLIADLEAQLDDSLRAGTAQKKLVMFTPDLRRGDPFVAQSYVFGRMTKSPARTPYLTTDAWLAHLGRHGLTPSVVEAKHTIIHLFDEADDARPCKAFECFGYELGFRGRQYVLSSGTWYEVSADFVKRVNSTIGRIERAGFTLPAWNQKDDEAAYNAACARDPTFLHFDMKNVSFGGGQSKFEFCDLMHPRTKTLVFAKIVSKSAGMSHLVEQVRRTSELVFSSDDAFRKKLKKVFEKKHPKANASWLDSRPIPTEWSLCLVSLGRAAGQLPFFAKCALVKLHKEMRERGHPVLFERV